MMNAGRMWLSEKYISETGEENTFERVSTATETTFVHDKLRSLADNYFNVTVDCSGNQGAPAENCYKSINAPITGFRMFTPNGGGLNEPSVLQQMGLILRIICYLCRRLGFLFRMAGEKTLFHTTPGERGEGTSFYFEGDDLKYILRRITTKLQQLPSRYSLLKSVPKPAKVEHIWQQKIKPKGRLFCEDLVKP